MKLLNAKDLDEIRAVGSVTDEDIAKIKEGMKKAEAAKEKAKKVDDIGKLFVSKEELARIKGKIKEAEALQAVALETAGKKFPLSIAQVTNNQAQKNDLFLLRNQKSTAAQAEKFLDDQSIAARNLSLAMINSVGEDVPAELSRVNAVEASAAVVAARRARQAEAASPLYERAFQKQGYGVTKPIDLSALFDRVKSDRDRLAPFGDDVMDKANELLEKARKHSREMLAKTGSITAEGSPLEESSREFRRGIQRALARLRKESDGKSSGKSTEIVQTLDDILERIDRANGDLEQLHDVKLQIDESLKKAGTDTSLGSSTKKELAMVQKELVEELRKQSPYYAKAMDEYIRMQAWVDELKYSPIGWTAKLEGDQVKEAGKDFFDPEESLESVDRSRRAILELPNGKAVWDQMVRQELDRRFGAFDGRAVVLGVGNFPNYPEKLGQVIFGKTDRQRDILMRALDADQRRRFKAFEKLLVVAERGREGQSISAPPLLRIWQLSQSIWTTLEAAAMPKKLFFESRKNATFEKNLGALGDFLLDPRWKERWDEIISVDEGEPLGETSFGQTI